MYKSFYLLTWWPYLKNGASNPYFRSLRIKKYTIHKVHFLAHNSMCLLNVSLPPDNSSEKKWERLDTVHTSTTSEMETEIRNLLLDLLKWLKT